MQCANSTTHSSFNIICVCQVSSGIALLLWTVFFLLRLLPNSIEVSFLVKIWNFSKTQHDSSWSLIKMVQMRINTLDKPSRKQSQCSCCLCRQVPLCLQWGCCCIYVRIDGSGAGESEHQQLLQWTRFRATAPTRQLTPSITPIPGGILQFSDLSKHALHAGYAQTHAEKTPASFV